MATGYPDYLNWPGRAGAGESIVAASFGGIITANTTGHIDLPVIPAGFEYIYQNIVISCDDDAAIHKLELINTNIPWTWFIANFITEEMFDFPGHKFTAGIITRIQITNRSDSNLTFEGTLFYATRPV